MEEALKINNTVISIIPKFKNSKILVEAAILGGSNNILKMFGCDINNNETLIIRIITANNANFENISEKFKNYNFLEKLIKHDVNNYEIMN